ncbi:MAG: hypothetical protein E5X00_04535 [Mesorhizobium sp.]|nr:MAG: hypothetical protein E5X00_04535 [Mesorhizobium sp.]
MMDLGHSLKNPAAQHRQPCGSMKIGALAAAHVEWRKYHHVSQRRRRTFVPIAASVVAFAIILAGVAGWLP